MSRIKSLFRSRSNNDNCSPRNLNANNAASNTNRNNSGSSQYLGMYLENFSGKRNLRISSLRARDTHISSPRSGGNIIRPRARVSQMVMEVPTRVRALAVILVIPEAIFELL